MFTSKSGERCRNHSTLYLLVWRPLFKGPKVMRKFSSASEMCPQENSGWVIDLSLHNILCLMKLLLLSQYCFGSLSICTVKRRPVSCEASVWIWAENIARNTLEFILLLLSAVTWPIKIREPVPLAAMHAHLAVAHRSSQLSHHFWSL